MERRSLNNGQVFNYWTIIDFSKEKRKYHVKCICGNTSYVSSSTLKSGKSKSCGCMQKQNVHKKIKNSNYLSIRKKIYGNYMRAAKRRNYSFDISFDEFSSLITENCYYCGQEPNMTYKYGRTTKINQFIEYDEFKYNGVDRIDNTKGYTDDNCVSCCKICNNSKSTLDLSEWKEWIEKVYLSQVK
jgi:hypothetical protein